MFVSYLYRHFRLPVGKLSFESDTFQHRSACSRTLWSINQEHPLSFQRHCFPLSPALLLSNPYREVEEIPCWSVRLCLNNAWPDSRNFHKDHTLFAATFAFERSRRYFPFVLFYCTLRVVVCSVFPFVGRLHYNFQTLPHKQIIVPRY